MEGRGPARMHAARCTLHADTPGWLAASWSAQCTVLMYSWTIFYKCPPNHATLYKASYVSVNRLMKLLFAASIIVFVKVVQICMLLIDTYLKSSTDI